MLFRHLVFLAYSVLMSQLRQNRVCEWAQQHLTTIGQSCMAVMRETLSKTIAWVVEPIESNQTSFKRIKIQLALP